MNDAEAKQMLAPFGRKGSAEVITADMELSYILKAQARVELAFAALSCRSFAK